jgi:hypothetical protein
LMPDPLLFWNTFGSFVPAPEAETSRSKCHVARGPYQR